MQTVQQNGLPPGQRFWRALVKLDFISKFFTWVMEALARITEPLASVSAIYIIICAGVPVLLVPSLYTLALALIIGSPELLVIGAFKIASRELSQGNKKGGWLMAACVVLLLLTALTVGDLFVWHWDTAAVNILMGCRCLAGIAYTFTRGIVTDDSEPVDVSQGSPVNLLLEQFTASITTKVQETVNLSGQQLLAEVNRVNQVALAEVNRVAQDVNRQHQQFMAELRQVNHGVQVELTSAIEELGQQSQAVLDAAVERLARANSQRLEAVYSRIEQVRVTLESNPSIPAVNGPGLPLRLPSRVNHQQAKQVHSEQATLPNLVNPQPVNQVSVNSQSEPEGLLDGSKVNAGKQFSVNHYQVHQVLPTLAVIMNTFACSKTLASRARSQAASELGLKAGNGE